MPPRATGIPGQGGTLTIVGSNAPPMQLAYGASIKLKDGSGQSHDVGAVQLKGRYQILNIEPASANQPNLLRSITIAPLDRYISEERARQFLLGMVIIEFAVMLLIVTNAAASTVTAAARREDEWQREDRWVHQAIRSA